MALIALNVPIKTQIKQISCKLRCEWKLQKEIGNLNCFRQKVQMAWLIGFDYNGDYTEGYYAKGIMWGVIASYPCRVNIVI